MTISQNIATGKYINKLECQVEQDKVIIQRLKLKVMRLQKRCNTNARAHGVLSTRQR